MPTSDSTKQKNRVERERRALLVESIRSQLVPAILQMGFEVAPPRGDNGYLQDFPPWGRFRRRRDPVVDLLEIQFSSHGRSKFRIQAGVAPRQGVDIWVGHRSIDDLGVHELETWFETHAQGRWRPLLRALRVEPLAAWFSMRSSDEGAIENLLRKVQRILPEMDLALREGNLGSHIRRVDLPWSKRPNPGSLTKPSPSR